MRVFKRQVEIVKTHVAFAFRVFFDELTFNYLKVAYISCRSLNRTRTVNIERSFRRLIRTHEQRSIHVVRHLAKIRLVIAKMSHRAIAVLALRPYVLGVDKVGIQPVLVKHSHLSPRPSAELGLIRRQRNLLAVNVDASIKQLPSHTLVLYIVSLRRTILGHRSAVFELGLGDIHISTFVAAYQHFTRQGVANDTPVHPITFPYIVFLKLHLSVAVGCRVLVRPVYSVQHLDKHLLCSVAFVEVSNKLTALVALRHK